MSGLLPLLLRRIRQAGPMTIAEYMGECLTHPERGYYTTRDPLGRAGDFTTAPEISQMFGEVIGLCLAQAWLDRGAPAPFVLAELGPGRGTLMADILRATARVPGFHAAKELHLVEVSPALRARQAEALSGAGPVWHDRVEDLPGAPCFSWRTSSSTRCRCGSSCAKATAGRSGSWGQMGSVWPSAAPPLPRSPLWRTGRPRRSKALWWRPARRRVRSPERSAGELRMPAAWR